MRESRKRQVGEGVRVWVDVMFVCKMMATPAAIGPRDHAGMLLGILSVSGPSGPRLQAYIICITYTTDVPVQLMPGMFCKQTKRD